MKELCQIAKKLTSHWPGNWSFISWSGIKRPYTGAKGQHLEANSDMVLAKKPHPKVRFINRTLCKTEQTDVVLLESE